VVVTAPDGSPGRDAGVHTVSERQMYGQGLGYEDLVRAVDVVISKPGYGIVSDCIANDTALLYTSRGHFPEYDVLVREMPRVMRCGFLEMDDFRSGRWTDALDRVAATPPPPVRPPVDGATVAARMIRDFLA
jgi:L-arabinokinase